MNWNDLFSLDSLWTIGTIIGTIAAATYTAYKTATKKIDVESSKHKEVPKNIKKQSDLDCAIIQEAERVKELLDADRVQIYEFHNGLHYANGRSASRTTCTYEVCRYGINSCTQVLSGIPLSVLPVFIKTLLDNDKLYVEDIEDIKTNMTSTYNFKKSMGIKSFYDIVIHNEDNEPVGFVAVQYCHKKSKLINEDVLKKFAWFVETKLFELSE